MIDIEDILIAAISLSNGIKLATNNKNHFMKIDDLDLV